MTKLALHDKKYGKIDRRRSAYYKWDYIYINNWYTRLAVGVAVAIMIGWFMFTDIYIKEIIPIFDIELSQYLPKYLAIFIGLIIVYTGISTMIFSKKYDRTQKRLRQYEELLNKLDQQQSFQQSREEGLYDSFESATSGS